MNSTATIYARLSGDATLTALLDTHGAAPAIFSERAPDAYQIGPKPCLVIAAAASDIAVETFTEASRLIVQDVRGYAPDTGSTAALDAIMRRVRALFHNDPASLRVAGGIAKISTVLGPVASPTTDPALIGRRVTLRLEIQQH
jgi:hypothetical protein